MVTEDAVELLCATPEKSCLRKARVVSPIADTGETTRSPHADDDPLASNIEKLEVLGTDLTSPMKKKRRSVTFDQKYLPVECCIDSIASAVIYHNGGTMHAKLARQKPGQKGYQILTPKYHSEAVSLNIDMEQAFKIVMIQKTGQEYTFTGAEAAREHQGDHHGGPANEIISLAPIRRDHINRIRMDILLDNAGEHLVAFVVSAGKDPSSTALMRLQGMHEGSEQISLLSTMKRNFRTFLQILLVVAVGVLLRSPFDNLYSRYKISSDGELLDTSINLVRNSRTVQTEFGAPVFDGNGVFDYHVDFYSGDKASFMVVFRSNHSSGGDRTTREWELEGTKNTAGDDEIPVTFDSDFLFGEMHVGAYRVNNSWHISSVDIDLYRTSKDYVDTLREWVFEWILSSIGAPSHLSIQVDEAQHLRVTLEIGHDGDSDGDGDHGANNIIQEKSQLIQGHRVVGYIRPDDDHQTVGNGA
eukprot:TRINITY_DN9291_c1_g1_i1.p1 TRINITY_DN9291_c1_g1~~TRINITY_DN9291_c1_g1_i1.p1  ORF type:complete len:501 (+),score=57.76 TRINITY_DN9291_c1_g1_i1:89-1504(+)